MGKTVYLYTLIGLIPSILYVLQIPGIHFTSIEFVQKTLLIPTVLGFALTGYLGWRLNQSRILMVMILFCIAYYATLHTEQLVPMGIGKIRLRQILCFAFPVSLVLVFLTRESRFLSKQNVIRVILALSPIIFMAGWFIFRPAQFHRFVSWSLITLGDDFRIPQLSIAAVLLFVIIFIRNKDKKIRPFMGAVLVSLIPFYAMAHMGLSYENPQRLTAYTAISFCSICLILLYSIIKMYWQRVYKDELTDIANRRALDENLATMRADYCIAMIDIDHFKKFNDTYGHDEGDNVLRFVAGTIEKIKGGKVYRYGGEEFCAVFENMSIEEAFQSAEAVRKNLAEQKFHIRTKNKKNSGRKGTSAKKPRSAKVTISLGIADSAMTQNASPDDVLKKADLALYQAKGAGRNRSVIGG